MRVALLTNFVAPYRVPLFRALAERVSALRLFVSTPMERHRDWDVDWTGLDVVRQRTLTLHGRYRHPAGFTEPRDVHLPWDTVRQLRRFRPDVVITGELGARSLLALAYARRIGHCPAVLWATLSERLEQGRGRARVALRRHLLKRIDAALVNGESGRRYLRRFGVPDAAIFALPQAIDGERFAAVAPERAGAAARRLLLVGRLSQGKGVDLLADALARRARACPGEPLELRVVGDGPLRERLAGAPPPNLRVDVRGPVPYERMPAEYAAAGILVFPTLADEWGLVVNEALAAGLPVLGSMHAQAVQELVRDGREGWVFDPQSAAAFDQALDRALTAPAERLDEMRTAARARVAPLTPEAAAQRMTEVLARVLAARAPRPRQPT